MKSEIKTGALIGYVSIAVQVIITLVYIPLSIKFIGQSEYGLYSLVTSIMAYFSVLDMGFGNAMIRFISKAKANKDEKEKSINGLFIVLYSIIGIISLIIGGILLKNINRFFETSLSIEELNKARWLMTISIITISLSFPLSIFQSYIMACEKFIIIKGLNLLRIILTPLTILCFLYYGHDSLAMVLITSIYTLLIQFINMIYCFRKLKMKFDFKIKKIDKSLLTEIVYYSFFIFLNIVVDNLYNNTDQVILGGISGTIAVSVYAIAAKISSINMLFSTSISGLFLPRVTKVYQEKNCEKNISDLFIRVSRIQLYIMMLILTGFIIFGKMFITLWVGQEYMDAYYITLLLIGPAVIPLTQNLGITVLQAQNKHAFRSVVYIAIAILNIIISIPLAKVLGGIGTAIGTAIATILGQIVIMNIYYLKEIKLDMLSYWKHFLKFATPLLLFAIGLKEFIEYNNLTLKNSIFIGILYVLFYLMYSYYFMNSYEKDYLDKIKSKLVKIGKREG